MTRIFKNSIFLFFILLINCQNPNNSSSEIVVSDDKTSTKASYNNDILGQYLRIKDALISSDVEKANIAADGLHKVLLNESKTNKNLNLKTGQLKEIAQNIIDADDIQIKRKSFFQLSEIIFEALQNKSISSKEESNLYLQFCPMAFNNSGGIWLSSEHDILNPYFGDMMLTCGVVRDTI